MEKDFDSPRTGEAIREVGAGAREEARRLGDEVRERSAEALRSQRERASVEIEGVANALRAGAERFDEQGQESFAWYTREAAKRVDRASTSVREADLRETLQDAERFAREHPAVIIGGACLLGFAAARFFKASEERQARAEVEVSAPTGPSGEIYEH